MMKLPAIAFALLGLPLLYAQDSAPEERLLHMRAASGKYDIALKKMEAKAALRCFFDLAKTSYSIDWDVFGDISLDLQATEFETALQHMTRQVDATYQVTKGKYRVMRRQGDWASTETTVIERKHRIEGSEKSIDRIEVEWVDVRTVLEDLGTVAKVPMHIDPAVQGKVSLMLDSVRFDVALKIILDEVNATYTRDGRGVHVKPKGG